MKDNINYFIGKYIVRLQDVGWYKRESKYNCIQLKTFKGDYTKDMPVWEASLLHCLGEDLYHIVPNYCSMIKITSKRCIITIILWELLKILFKYLL